MRIRPITAIFAVLFFLSCSGNDDSETSEFPQIIQARTFEIQTPEGWVLIEDQGYDSYVGRITNNDLTLHFDFGSMSFWDLGSIKETSETLFLERTIINGVPAVIEKKRNAGKSLYQTILSVYFDNGENKNRLYVLDSNDDEFFIEVFRTHTFIK